MKKILLFFIMVLLVFVSARSLFCSCEDYGPHHSLCDKSKRMHSGQGARKAERRRSFYAQEVEKKRHDNHIANQEYAHLRGELDDIVSHDIDEFSLHTLLRLLDLELKLVDNLLSSKTGHDVERLLMRKEKLLKAATKTAAYAYGAIMNFATSDILFTGKKNHVKPGELLQGSDKRRYLKRMKKILAEYKGEFGNKQYYVSERTFGLPTQRYRPYVAQLPRGTSTSIAVQQKMFSQPHVYSESNHYSDMLEQGPENIYDMPYGMQPNYSLFNRGPGYDGWGLMSEIEQGNVFPYGKRRFARNERRPDSKFASLWRDFVGRVRNNEVMRMIDDVLSLVKNEMRSHIDSLSQRDKMFYGGRNYNINMNIDVDDILYRTSARARALFGTIREAATENTIRLGYWNPDVYEDCLERYADRLERAKIESQHMLDEFRQDIHEKYIKLQGSVEHLIDSFVYSLVPSRR